MAENKTQPTKVNPLDFIASVDPKRQDDCKTLLKMMEDITGEQAVMWGPSIVGFGLYHYKYASGREGDFMRCGFSPRKQDLTVYIMSGFKEYGDLLSKLGKYKTSVSCLYLKKLADVDLAVLREMIERSVAYMDKTYPRS